MTDVDQTSTEPLWTTTSIEQNDHSITIDKFPKHFSKIQPQKNLLAYETLEQNTQRHVAVYSRNNCYTRFITA